MKILIAEDDAVSRLILQRAMEKFGHEVLAAEDGERAWEIYTENPDVDAIVSDGMMPGFDSPRRPRTGRCSFSLPALTAYSSWRLSERVLANCGCAESMRV